MDTKGILLWAVFAVIFLAGLFFSKRMKRQIEEDGIETLGVISRIVETGDPDEISLQYYARYRTEDGEEIEGILSNPATDLTVGQQVRLKYHPKYKENARLI